MADVSKPNRPRPLSPHIDTYRWGPHMLASIVHRGTGIALSAGGVVLCWWLLAAATGDAAYEQFQALIGSIPGQLIMLGFTYALIQHALGGLRHLYMDTGRGYEIRANRRMAMLTFIASILITAVIWAFIKGYIS